MTRRRITVDLCTYTQDTTNINSSPNCTRKASFTVGPVIRTDVNQNGIDASETVLASARRVCLGHVGHAVEIFKSEGCNAVPVYADYERDGGFTDDADA